MLEKKLIQELIDERIAELDNGLYVVDLRISPTNVIHVELDKLKGGVSVSDCMSVSRNIEHNLDREQADFELHVSSAGLDKPIRHINQFAKNVGRSSKFYPKLVNSLKPNSSKWPTTTWFLSSEFKFATKSKRKKFG